MLSFNSVTQRKRVSKDRIYRFVNSIPVLMWAADEAGSINYLSDQWYDYSGVNLDLLLGNGWLDIVHADDRVHYVSTQQEAVKTKSLYEVEIRIRNADGVYRHFIVRAKRVSETCDPGIEWLGICTDVEDIQIAKTKYDQIQADAEAALRAKDEFLAVLSHELRTPLNAILGWTQTLQSGVITKRDTLVRALTIIRQSAQTQAHLIDELLDASDAISGKLHVNPQPIEISPILHAAIKSVQPTLSAKKIRLETAVSHNDCIIQGDPIRLQQIFWNLLSNAARFTPREGRISVSLSRCGSYLKTSISDNGEGISADVIPYVFDRFRQADSSTKRQFGGLGLGLAMVRHLVDLHGGAVQVDSPGKGKGATFSVWLPIYAPGDDYVSALESNNVTTFENQKNTRPGKLSGMRILSVDDDVNTREMMQEVLECAGAEVISAESARDALDKLQHFRPDVLLSDIGMPEEDGYDLLHKVRSLPPEQGGATPAIALTGYTREQDRSATAEAGYQALMPKPINLEDLLTAITSVTAGQNRHH